MNTVHIVRYTLTDAARVDMENRFRGQDASHWFKPFEIRYRSKRSADRCASELRESGIWTVEQRTAQEADSTEEALIYVLTSRALREKRA